MPFQVTPEFVNKFTKQNYTHSAYKKTVEIADHLHFHFDGYDQDEKNPYFDILIGNRRPSESADVLKYRAEIYRGKTIETTSKIINTIKKIDNFRSWLNCFASVNFRP